MNNGGNAKKIIGCLIILLCVLIVIILILINTKKEEDTYYLEENGDNYHEDYAMSRDSYFDVNSCMNIYLNAINISNEIVYYEYDENEELSMVTDDKETKNRIYSLLSDKYIKENNITIDNLNKHIKTIKQKSIFVPLEMSMIQKDEINSFLVYGLIEDIKDFSVIDKIFAIVNIDIENNVFSIEPIYGDYNTIKDIKIKKPENKINENTYNKYVKNETSSEEASKDYMNLYKRIVLGNPDIMYELLNKEYRDAKFETLDEFKKYVKDNKDVIIGTRLEQYKTSYKDDYIQYTCIDQYGKNYIFIETDVLKYSVFLDTYTIDLPEFIEKYQTATIQEKVALNIQKIVEAINLKDYNYVYGKLADEFKENYFKTYEDFEEYASKTFDIENELIYNKYTETKDLATYKITLIGKTKTLTKTIVMKLEQGTDFVMSFNVN